MTWIQLLNLNKIIPNSPEDCSKPTDEQTNPTILWPEGRKEARAGTLTITSVMPNAEAGSFKINYDPLVMADGIQPTNDPVLLFRSPSYATSFTRRLRGI